MTTVTPSREQQEILELGLTSIKVRAGAGTGKTTTVAMVIAGLVRRHGVQPEQVLGITFTNKAAAELADRVREMLDAADPARQSEVHTYHGFAAQTLAEFGPLAGIDPRFQVITPTFARQLLKDVVLRSDPETLNLTWATTYDRIRSLHDRLGDHLLTPSGLLAHPDDTPVGKERREMAEILQEYEREKRRLGVVDFSDLVTLTTRLMTQNPELADLVRGRYRVVVLDEYQDTNPAQRTLLNAIFGRGFPVVAVGDEDQTIYEWRGASAENFAQFQDHFPTPGGQPPPVRSLTLNRRSTQKILDVANRVRLEANTESEPLVSALGPDPESVVRTHWAPDSIAEAEWIAARFEELHEAGTRWRDMAVLLRKNKDFSVIVDAFARHDIPVEVANLGGLLSVPEVADLVAWLRVLEHPEDSVSLTTILVGSRYRLGMADLARLAAVATVGAEEDHEGTPIPVTLLEAVEVEAIPGLSPEAAQAIADFRPVYRRALLESQGLSLVEVCRLVLDLTGAWRDIEALPRNQRLTARLNLYRLLDLAEHWSPLQGRPSLPAFLDYLDTTTEERSDEVDSARISGEDAVTLVTVHRAKGLEWDTVAVPTVYAGNFPSGSSDYGNPLKAPHAIPVELRLDTVMAHLMDDEGVVQDFLRQAHARQEWRTAYVALTRARRRLFVTGAYWYGYPLVKTRAVAPSTLWHLVNQATGDVPHLPEVTERPELVRFDQGPNPDPLFEDGWDGAIRAGLSDQRWPEEMATRLDVGDDYHAISEETEMRLFTLDQKGEEVAEPAMATVSVTGLVTYSQCPKRYFWSEVDPLPRRSNPAAIKGTEVHRRIELHQRGVVPLGPEDHPYDGVEREVGTPGAYQTYLASRFARARAQLVEQPFTVEVGDGHRIRGRIDAIYSDGRHWEVVDFKSGRPHDDPARIVQLHAYAVAVNEVDFGIPGPEALTMTFAFLGGGGSEESHQADLAWLEDARSSVASLVEGIGAARFPEMTGEWCGRCDFLRFCPPGREAMGR